MQSIHECMKGKYIHNHGLPLPHLSGRVISQCKRYHSAMSRNVKKLPFVDDYLAALLAQASVLISKEFHAIVMASGFTVSEWRILATLTDQPGMNIGQLARVSVTKQPTVTRMLDRMVDKELVERFAHAADRRMTLVKITPKGRKIINDLVAKAKDHEHHVLAPFGHENAEVLKDTLREIIRLHTDSA